MWLDNLLKIFFTEFMFNVVGQFIENFLQRVVPWVLFKTGRMVVLRLEYYSGYVAFVVELAYT